MNRISLILNFLLAIVIASTSESARASGPSTVSGKWAGIAFANPLLDLDGDGIPGREFDLRAYGQLAFIALQGTVDACLAGAPPCPAAAGTCASTAIELVPSGRFLLRGLDGNAAYATVDSSRHLCFDPTNPDEALAFVISGGRGIYAGKTGSGVAHIHDVVLVVASNGIAPLVIDSQGEFAVTIN